MIGQCCQLLLTIYPVGLMDGMFKKVEAATNDDWRLALHKMDRGPVEAPLARQPRAEPSSSRHIKDIRQHLKLLDLHYQTKPDMKHSAEKRHKARLRAVNVWGLSKVPLIP